MGKTDRHSAEFKSKVALEPVKGMRTVSELAGKYQIHPTQISRWKLQVQECVNELFANVKGPKRLRTNCPLDREAYPETEVSPLRSGTITVAPRFAGQLSIGSACSGVIGLFLEDDLVSKRLSHFQGGHYRPLL